MMRALRRSTKTIMIIVAAAFVIGFIFLQLGVNVTGSGGQTTNVLGTVNGVEITYSMYNDMRSQLFMQLRQSQGMVTDDDFMRVEEQVWDELVYQILLQQEIERMGITVTDDEILEEMKNNPPDFLRSNEAFLTDGEFDQTKYLQALYSPQNDVFVMELENWYRSVLPIQKLQDYLLSTVHITDSQLKNEFQLRNEKVTVGYLAFHPDKLVDDETIEITETDIADYYKAHKNDYRVEKQVVLEYVEFPIVPNSEDSASALQAINEVKALLTEGLAFDEVALDYSQDPASAEKGGDLGWVPKGKMAQPVEDAAFALEKGEISDVVGSEQGFHLIKLEDRRTTDRGEEVHIRHILVKLEPSYLTVSDISDAARDARDRLAEAKDFYALADSMGLEVNVTNPALRGEQILEIGPTTVPTAFGFSHKSGDISTIMRIKEQFVFVRVKQVLPAGFKKLDDVRVEIEGNVRNKKKMDEVKQIATLALEQAKTNGDLRSVAEEFEVEYKETGEITKRGTIPDIGRFTEFTGIAFGLQVGDISDLIELPQGVYILEVLNKTSIEESAFELGREQIRREMENYYLNSMMGTWYEALKQEADIEDNREMFFQQT